MPRDPRQYEGKHKRPRPAPPRCVAALACALLAPAAAAESYQLHLVSKHADSGDHNEENYGIGYRGDGRSAPVAGYYTNSLFRDSFYAGWNWRLPWRLSATGAVVTGYTGASSKLIGGELLPLPMLHWRPLNAPVTPMVSYVPTDEGGVVLLSINIRR